MYEIFKKLVNTRQSCRDFNDKPVDKSDVLELAQLARLCPSACNSQPWKLYAVTEGEKVKAVAQSLQEGGRNPFLNSAKAFIAISEKTPRLKPDAEKRFSRDFFVKYDIGETLAYITLGAKAKGLDTCIIGWINHDKLNAAISLPEDETVNVVVAIGYSDCALREKMRKDSTEIIIDVK